MTTAPLVAIVIVNYDGRHLLGDCIDSVALISIPHEVIVVDNSSHDGSVAWLRERYPRVTVVESGSNLGFGRACNLGVAYSHSPYILLLNSDARLRTCAGPAIRYMEDAKGVSVVGGRLIYPDGRFQPSIGLEHTPLRVVASWTGLGFIRGASSVFQRVVSTPGSYAAPLPDVPWVSGALMLVKRKAWESAGGMCSDYFMYMEDVDFCRQVRSAGGRVAYLPFLEAVHLEGGGKEWVGAFALLNTVSSYEIYFRRHYGRVVSWAVRIGLLPVFAARAAANAAIAIVSNSKVARDKARAFASACQRLLG